MLRNDKRRIKRMKGFTLLEILIVIAMIAIFATTVAVNIIDKPDQARRVAAKQDIRTIISALNMYRLDNLRYPDSLDQLITGSYKYLDRLPVDPWKRDYVYQNPGSHGKYDIYSYGQDGILGGAGLDADIGSWNLDED